MPPSARNDGSDRLPNTLPTHEERQRDQHAAGAAAGGVERAGAAAIGELHADAEGEGADDERGPERRDGAAEFRRQRRDRHDRERGDRDHDQPAEQAARLAAREEAPPRGGVAELGLEEGDAEPEAAEDQRGRGRRPSSSTSATRIAVAPSASARNRRSKRAAAPERGAASDLRGRHSRSSASGSGAEAERLLQVIPLGARGLNRPVGIAGPLHHRAGIEPGVLVAEQFVQHEPVGRGPMAGVAIGAPPGRPACRWRSLASSAFGFSRLVAAS